MITINSIVGNIYRDRKLHKKYEEMLSRSLCETIKISRLESQRVRMRKVTNKDTDVALILPSGSKIRHGDIILLTEDKLIIVELEPEDVIMVKMLNNIHDDDIVKLPVRIGHTIGNLHRPIKIEGRSIYFPIQSESEVGMFQKLLSSVMDHLEIKSMKMVFEPEEGLDSIHEH